MLLNLLKRPFNMWFPARGEGNAQGLGTFSGVYLPSVLQMLGVILFMRLGWITGHIGLPKMTLIIFMASSILFLTGLSMTSIVTNMKVGSGGSYYIISRSLGVEFGSAIGILLTIAQLTTIAVCVSGFALSLQELMPHLSLNFLEICTLAGLAIVALFPVDFALKAQGGIFCILIASIVSVFFGSGSQIPETVTPLPNMTTISFWAAFALFFPATTGIESGMAMSGDLKNPSRSLAIGTMAAVVTAFVAYLSLSIFLSSQVSSELLKSHPMIIYYVSKVSSLFVLGVWCGTLSSALGSMITSPRTLQSLAKDHILPKFLSKSVVAPGILIICLASLMTLFTDMNHLLPILSMVCLMTYGLLNFVAFFESFIQNPSWRPLFRTPMGVSLAGTLACLVSMFMINAGWAFIILVAVIALGLWTTKRKLQGNWDDIRYSIFSFFASTATNKLVHLKKNPRSWRPNILAIVDPELRDTQIVNFAHALNQKKGFLTYGATLPNTDNLEITQTTFEDYFRKRDIPCFFHINAHNIHSMGTHNIVQNYGMGPLQPNTIILKPPADKPEEFCELIKASHELQKNLVIVKSDPTNSSLSLETKDKHIDLWWGGQVHSNFELSLALSHLLQAGKMWPDATITIKTLVKNEAARIHMAKLFEKYHSVLRVKNLHFKSYLDESTDFYAHITDYSTDADLTFLGIRAPEREESIDAYTSYFKTLLKKTEGIPSVAYVLAGERLDFQRIFE
ncbi:MAG: amino acid permease [Chlamydiales bacterium]|nr:amino acid permease [Chlamydiales bacterium]